MSQYINGKIAAAIAVLLGLFIITPWMIGINYAGHRTVIQYPSGTLVVKFTPGVYMQWFGNVTEYPDIITFDFDKTNSIEATIKQVGIAVRYQDGGTGTIFGQARFNLPNDEASMILLHKAFRSPEGIASKLVRPETEQAANLTAGLMSSEEAYTERRGTYIEWVRAQVQKGRYKTKLELRHDEEQVTGRRVIRNVPVIDIGTDGFPQHLDNDLKVYGITVSGFQVTDWNFEQKTLDQIAAKREATMGIITAKANAERAKQDAITAEEQGKRDVTVAKYIKEQEKVREVVDAEKEREVAIIGAQKLVQVAEQTKLEAEQKKLAAVEYKEEQILRGEGDAAYKRLVLEADGALSQKIAAYQVVMGKFAEAVGKQRWVPDVQFGVANPDGKVNNNAAALIDIFTAMALKQLGLDISVPTGKKATP